MKKEETTAASVLMTLTDNDLLDFFLFLVQERDQKKAADRVHVLVVAGALLCARFGFLSEVSELNVPTDQVFVSIKTRNSIHFSAWVNKDFTNEVVELVCQSLREKMRKTMQLALWQQNKKD